MTIAKPRMALNVLAVLAAVAFHARPSMADDQREALLREADTLRKAAAEERQAGNLDKATELQQMADRMQTQANSLQSVTDPSRPAGAQTNRSPGSSQVGEGTITPDADATHRPQYGNGDASDQTPDYTSATAAELQRYSATLPQQIRDRSRMFGDQARDLLRQGERAAAANRAKDALDINPGNVSALLVRADVAGAENNGALAHHLYSLIRQLDPDSPEAAIAGARLEHGDKPEVDAATSVAKDVLDETKALSSLQGNWCWTQGVASGRNTFSGNRVSVVASAFGFSNSNAGTMAPIGPNRFRITLTRYPDVQTVELVDSNTLRWKEKGTVAKRCD